jgi:hypothetical protein
MQLRKALSIFLIVCFFMSVTAASVSAEKNSPFNHHGKHFIPGHWEYKSVKTVVMKKVFINHHWKYVPTVVYKLIKVWVGARWI